VDWIQLAQNCSGAVRFEYGNEISDSVTGGGVFDFLRAVSNLSSSSI
jgi:hypothetical protein